MSNDNYDQAVQGVMDSVLIRQIISALHPDPAKLREAITASIRAAALAAEQEAVKDFKGADVRLAAGECLAVWGTPSEPDAAAVVREKEISAQLTEVFYKLQAVATPGELRVIYEENAFAGFAEVVHTLRRHGIRFSI